MSNAAEQSGSGESRRRLIERSVTDEAFRESLLADPKGSVERELGMSLPERVEVKVVEETPETVYLVLPPKAAASQEGDELSERDLEAVAGGYFSDIAVNSFNVCAPTGSRKTCDPLP